MTFYLPDRLRELAAVEQQLREDFSHREDEYRLVRENLPAGANPRHTPAFYALLVAHRKWQFAYEKKRKIERAKA